MLLKELIESKKDFQEIFPREFFNEGTVRINARVNILNFCLDGVDPEKEIKKSVSVTERFLDTNDD